MMLYNYILISMLTFSFTLSIYYFLQIVFVYRSLSNKYFYFSLITFLAALYLLFQFFYINADFGDVIFFEKMKMLVVGLVAPVWFVYLYTMYFKDKKLLITICVLAILPVFFIPTGLYFKNEISVITKHFFGGIINFKVVKGSIFYDIHSLIIISGGLVLFVKILFSKIKLKDKILVFFVFSPIIGGINDFLITSAGLNSVFIIEFFFFISVFSLFVYFFREERIRHLQLENMNTVLENEVFQRTGELSRVNEKLRKLDSVKNDFIANITHDFRSPLMVILNIADLNLKFGTSDQCREEFEIIYKSSLRLKKTIDTLLDLAKMDARGIVLKISRLNIADFVNGIADYYVSALMYSNLKIIKKIPSLEIDNFYADPEKIEEILNNIISNAIKFVSMENGVVEIELAEEEDSIVIAISDNGIGIPPDKLDIIFNRFKQLDTGINARQVGTGIGLSYSKELVEYMGGKLWAESGGSGEGAKFFIRMKKGKDHFNNGFAVFCEQEDNNFKISRSRIELDIKKKPAESGPNLYFKDLNSSDELDFKKGIILIIDDDEAVARIVMEYLKNNGFCNFILSYNGETGLDAVYKYKPDLIICDYNMPGMKGDEIHDELAGNPKYKNIPFVFLSAIADKNIIMERRGKGAVAYLKKPVEEKDLILTIELHLRKYFEYMKTLRLAVIDELTGLYNRNESFRILNRELSVRNYRDISVIIFDIDAFKKINEIYGHRCGDKILEETGKILKGSLRECDTAGRYGVDEFILILPDTGMEKALCVVENLKRRLFNRETAFDGSPINITGCFGISSLKDNEGFFAKRLNVRRLEDIIVGKKTGRDRIKTLRSEIAAIMINTALKALGDAKTVECPGCGHIDNKFEIIEGKCPKCGCIGLKYQINKISCFKN